MKVGFAFQMACAGILTIAAADAACAATATRADFGRLPDGTRIEAVTLTGRMACARG